MLDDGVDDIGADVVDVNLDVDVGDDGADADYDGIDRGDADADDNSGQVTTTNDADSGNA